MSTWDEMSKRLEVHQGETGSLEVALEDDRGLHKWIKEQKRALALHFQGELVELSNEQIHMLKTIGYGPTRPGCLRPHNIIDSKAAEAKWDSMLQNLKAYKEKNGGVISFPDGRALPKGPDRDLRLWVMEQRREYRILSRGGDSKLTAKRMQRLNGIGLDIAPRGETFTWEDRMDMLRRFKEERGHCRPENYHGVLCPGFGSCTRITGTGNPNP